MIRRVAAVVCLLLLPTFVGGCTTTIIPPSKPADPTTIYVTNYGRHSSLLLPESPESEDRYVEYAFGDWDWFAEGHKSSSSGVHALLFSKDSALGRRELEIPSTAPSDAEIARVIDTKEVGQLTVSRARADALREKLDAIYNAHIDTKVYNQKARLWFVKYNGGYGLCHNCNHATANWLRDLGCTIRGPAMFSKFRVKS